MFAERLARQIADKNLNQNKVANATGISSGLITYYVKGEKKPSSENLMKIADFLEVSTDYLLGRTNSPTHTINGNVMGIGIVHDVSGGTIIGNNTEREMTAEEAELLRIFNLLDVKGRHKILELAFSMEEDFKGVKNEQGS